MVGLGVCIILAALAIWAFQGYWWLKHGFWLPLTVNTVLDVQPETINSIEWHGIGLIVIWALEQPLAAAVMVLGMVVVVIGEIPDGPAGRRVGGEDDDK